MLILLFQYSQLTQGALSDAQVKLGDLLKSLDAVSAAITSEATANEETEFPFAPASQFLAQASILRNTSDLEMIAYAPFVPEGMITSWQQFGPRPASVQIDENTASNYFDLAAITSTISGQNTQEDGFGTGKVSALVLHWSPAPSDNSLYGIDVLVDGTQASPRILSNGTIFGSINEIESDNVTSVRSAVVAPVFGDLSSDALVTGMLLGYLRWDTFISSLLQDSCEGIIAVLKNTCGEAATFRCDDQKVRTCGSMALCPLTTVFPPGPLVPIPWHGGQL